MKELLEEAIEEIGREPLKGSGVERELPEEGFQQIESGGSRASPAAGYSPPSERGIAACYEIVRIG